MNNKIMYIKNMTFFIIIRHIWSDYVNDTLRKKK